MILVWSTIFFILGIFFFLKYPLVVVWRNEWDVEVEMEKYKSTQTYTYIAMKCDKRWPKVIYALVDFISPTHPLFFSLFFISCAVLCSSSMSTTRCNITPKSRQLSSDKPREHYLSKALFKCWTKVRVLIYDMLLLTWYSLYSFVCVCVCTLYWDKWTYGCIYIYIHTESL